MTLKTSILKTSILAFAALTLLSLPSQGRADLIKAGTSHYKDILVTDPSGNNVLGLTTASFTANAASNGGAGSTVTTPAITERGLGHYWMLIPASLTGTPGTLSIVLTTASGTVQTDSKDDVIATDPTVDLAAALTQNYTGILAVKAKSDLLGFDSSSYLNVHVLVNGDKTGYQTVNSLSRYTFNVNTQVLTVYPDTGSTPLGSVTLVKDANGNITSRM